jgi:hypothetical protein
VLARLPVGEAPWVRTWLRTTEGLCLLLERARGICGTTDNGLYGVGEMPTVSLYENIGSGFASGDFARRRTVSISRINARRDGDRSVRRSHLSFGRMGAAMTVQIGASGSVVPICFSAVAGGGSAAGAGAGAGGGAGSFAEKMSPVWSGCNEDLLFANRDGMGAQSRRHEACVRHFREHFGNNGRFTFSHMPYLRAL